MRGQLSGGRTSVARGGTRARVAPARRAFRSDPAWRVLLSGGASLPLTATVRSWAALFTDPISVDDLMPLRLPTAAPTHRLAPAR
jgi:hypothetical protein